MKLHDFSEVYGIKESALRYWEKAGILSAKRMENQKYRDLSTNISRLLYLDILYYRKNGVAVKDMTDFDKMDEEQIFEMLEKTETKLDEQLALLNRQRDNLRQRQCMIKFLRDFGKKPYRLVKLPDLCLVTESEPYTRLLADQFSAEHNNGARPFDAGNRHPARCNKQSLHSVRPTERQVPSDGS